MPYTLTDAELAALKARLTRAENRAKKEGDPQVVIDEVKHAMRTFEAKGHPDSWSRWTRAGQDAEFRLQRKNEGLSS
jgi:hypothetical protein